MENTAKSSANRFRFVGRNKKFNTITVSEPLTTTDLLTGNYPSFFTLENRKEDGNCEFLAETRSTGLTDKNGKEIFYEDIVERDGRLGGGYPWYHDKENGKMIERVTFDGYEISPFYGSGSDWHDDSENWGIIGNIYESPSLLS